MALKRIVKRLRREAAASPKKAAVLGLVSLVALWFWAPLMKGWFTTPSGNMEVAAAIPADAGAAAPPASQPAATGAKPATGPQVAWRQWVEWIESDPRTRPTQFARGGRDPFAPLKPKLAEAKPKDGPEKAQSEITPEGLGLVLSSTVAGAGSGTARINGQSYQQGKTVRASKDGEEIEFRLAEVHPLRVVLERGGMRYELRSAAPAPGDRVELRRKKK